MVVHWTADGQAQQAQWHADNGLKPPKRMVVVDDTLNADAAASHQSVVTAMDVAARLGFAEVRIATVRGEAAGEGAP